MARYRATDTAERRTASLRSWVTPAEHQRIREAATRAGTPLSDYVRELCLHRGGQPRVVAGTQRNPAAKALADELRAIGINLNQLARVANQTGELRREGELSMTIDLLKAAMQKAIGL
jgi:hypothetical protein